MEGRATPPAPRSPTRSQVVEREVEEMAAKRREMDELESALKAKSESLDARVSRLRVSAEKQRSAGRARRTPVPSRSPASSRAPASPRSPASSRRGRPVATPSASPRRGRPAARAAAEPRCGAAPARRRRRRRRGGKWASLSSEIDDALGAAARGAAAAAAAPAEPAAARQTALADESGNRGRRRRRAVDRGALAAAAHGRRRAGVGAALGAARGRARRAALGRAPSADELFDETLCALASTRALRAGALGRGDGAAFGGACVVVDVCGVDALRDETTDRFQNTRGEGGLRNGGGAAAPAAPPGACACPRSRWGPTRSGSCPGAAPRRRRALAVGGGEIGDVVATVDAKARLLKRGWPKAAFEPEDFAARGKFTTLVRARKPPPPRGPASTKEPAARGPRRRAEPAGPVGRAISRALLAREDAAARATAARPRNASGRVGLHDRLRQGGGRRGLTQATRDGAAKAVSRGVRGFGGRVADAAASDDWITVCAAFFAEPPLRASAGRGAAAALAVDYALTALETAARMTWASAPPNGAASKVNWAALDARHAHDGAAPRVLCDEATQRAARKQTVALPLPYFPRGADFSGDAPDDSAAAAAALKGPHLASPWGAKRAVGFSRDGHFMLLPAAEAPDLAKQLAKRAFALAFGHCRAADDGAPPAGPAAAAAAAARRGRSAFAKLLPALLGAGSYDDALADALWARSGGDAATATDLAFPRDEARTTRSLLLLGDAYEARARCADRRHADAPGGEERAAAALAHHAVGAGDAELACEAAAGLAALGGATFVAAFATVAVSARRAGAIVGRRDDAPEGRGRPAKLKLPATDDADPADFEAGALA
ncbi:hypothetical protein JL722_7484 [Aureococcus anophagefferens]|nr:hypothetical protein JL722_7484 [Aureococcus anophagefferens]